MISRRVIVVALAGVAVSPVAFAQPTLRPVRLLVVRRPANLPSSNCAAPCIRGSVYDVGDVQGPIAPAAIFTSHRTPICDVIERPWAGNAPSISAVPKGVYAAKIRTDATKPWMETTPSRAWRIEISGVPGGRSAIQFHYGTDVKWSEGCFIVGRLLDASTGGGIGANYCKVEGADDALAALRSAIEGPGNDRTRIEVTVADSTDLFGSGATTC
ncbi:MULTISPECIES: DUF5675 family protein [unclassified Sphingopyxis]|uniref:DUF5675 family protein n=1 Tax=unclassified Sphingopyxis TaxID=2614943 RepID=UPI0007360773|nr:MULTISPECIES: DUF5675 family protein [unclassified Sphingopyxis]KTE30409.1 hypothetical protein ATE62_20505 [Sphingopyxis sp. HIX]KTE84770.1 hypothetical protein ATE72_06940 [Sphingopyxis sp. HXXIV]